MATWRWSSALSLTTCTPQVFTSRTENVAHHRSIQTAVCSAVGHALRLAMALPGASSPSAAPFVGLPPLPKQLVSGNGDGADGSAGSHYKGSNDRASAGQRDTAAERASGAALNGSGTAGSNGAGQMSADTSSAGTFVSSAPQWQPHCVQVASASLHQFSLPLAAGLTTVSSVRCTNHSGLLSGRHLLLAYEVGLSCLCKAGPAAG